eukprot:1145470-Pelagomonas_calceolata.AAC.2
MAGLLPAWFAVQAQGVPRGLIPGEEVCPHLTPHCSLCLLLVHVRELPRAEILGVHLVVLGAHGPLRLLVVFTVPGPEGDHTGVQFTCREQSATGGYIAKAFKCRHG